MSTLNAFEQHLVSDHIITEDDMARCLQQAKRSERPVLEVLSDAGLATSEYLYKKLAQYCELPYVTISITDIPESLAQDVPARYAAHFGFAPIGYEGDSIVVAISRPMDSNLTDEIRMVLKRPVQAVVALPTDIEKASRQLYGLGADTVEQIILEISVFRGVYVTHVHRSRYG